MVLGEDTPGIDSEDSVQLDATNCQVSMGVDENSALEADGQALIAGGTEGA